MKDQIVNFVTQNGPNLSFDVFAAQINDLVGQDRNWNNLLFVMHLGKRVVQSSMSVSSNIREYYGRYVATAFGEEIAQAGSAVSSMTCIEITFDVSLF